jgi:hypothetical protein
LAIWPQGGSPKWPLPMATILPGSFLRKTDENKIFGHLALGRVPKVATSDGHHFARKFPEKKWQKQNFWPFGLWEGPQSGHFRWPLFCQEVPVAGTKVLASERAY